ncbi:hypothetical protein BB560_001549 [Smittium megazygosporum]|uniref:Squalene synthase n=1 Tax=Smittium megazygosporum TaxID=133381 RepID=A0A2T9ZH99_9FUNG|nr:hypothetical protein BB560_001549 [Smittium megazygosporum]
MASEIGKFFSWVSHPEELICSILYLLRHSPPDEKTNKMDTSSSMKACYNFLEQTSRSFAAVIQELHPKLRDVICIYYLVLRGLDTIEDDMTINIPFKKELLINFHTYLYEIGWTFEESGPNEKDAPLLVSFNIVIDEFLKLDVVYQNVIADITKEMGKGMTIYIEKRITTIEDYDEYCHYVAGLVGIGLSKIFYASGLEDEKVGNARELSNSMGLFLQKVNIIRDINEDLLDNRRIWPTQIWSNYVNYIGDLIDEKNVLKSTQCLNNMCLNSLKHIPQVIEYLSLIRDPSVFKFCAIPQVMAIATIATCLNNPTVLQENVKIRKGEAIRLIYEASDLNNCQKIMIRYLDVMLKKLANAQPDPNYDNLVATITSSKKALVSRTKFTFIDYASRSAIVTAIIATIFYTFISLLSYIKSRQ